nr:glycosyltransferase family A protein [Mobiluncus porci]
MPAFNEGEHVSDAARHLREAGQRANLATRLIVVDDGSNAPSAQVLDRMAADGEIVLLRQANSGRFVARARGLAASETDYVLLLDARVNLDAKALVELRRRVAQGRGEVWNLHVRLANVSSLAAAFWSGLVKVWWRDYWRNPRPVTIDGENFDRFPKGTGAFFAPRSLLASAMDGFTSSFDNPKLVSDDTGLLRALAEDPGIHLDPAVGADYFGKEGVQKWIKQCFYRGTTFVDSYLGASGRGKLGTMFAGLSLGVIGGAYCLWRKPFATLGTVFLGSLSAGAVVKACGGNSREAQAVGLLAAPFGVVFGGGLLRGLAIAWRGKLREDRILGGEKTYRDGGDFDGIDQ